MSSRPSRIGSNVQRYESGLKNPQPPGAITSPPRTSPRKARRMSVLSSEIMKFNPDGSDKVSQYPDIGAKKDSYGALPVDSDSDDEGGKSGRPRSSDVSPRSTREASRSPVRSATTGLKSLGGSSYDLGEFYASMTPSEETTKTKKSPRPRSALFSRSPRSPVLGSATQQAAAERSGRRRSPRAGRKKYNEEGKVTSADDANSMKSKSSKLQLLDDLLAQVKSTHDSFSVQLGDAKKEAKRIMKRTERDGRRLTYTKTRLDGALHGAQDTVHLLKTLATRHTLGALPDVDEPSTKQRWRRALRKISFKNAVATTKLDLLARSEKAKAAQRRRADSKEQS